MSEEITLIKLLANNFQSILTVVGSIGGTIVGGVISAKATHKNDAKRTIREKRLELYYDFFSKIEPIINDRSIIFSDQYFKMLVNYKPKMKLLTSKKTYNTLENFYNYVRTEYYDFTKYLEKNDPENDPRNKYVVYDEDGNQDEIIDAPEEEVYGFLKSIEKYKREHVPTLEKVNETFMPLYLAMREDIGSKF